MSSRPTDGTVPGSGDQVIETIVRVRRWLERPLRKCGSETMSLEQAPEAYARMIEGKARFRIVLNIAEPV